MEYIKNLLVMDGQGKYVWFVLLVFFIVVSLNYYVPYRAIKKIKEESSESSGE